MPKINKLSLINRLIDNNNNAQTTRDKIKQIYESHKIQSYLDRGRSVIYNNNN